MNYTVPFHYERISNIRIDGCSDFEVVGGKELLFSARCPWKYNGFEYVFEPAREKCPEGDIVDLIKSCRYYQTVAPFIVLVNVDGGLGDLSLIVDIIWWIRGR